MDPQTASSAEDSPAGREHRPRPSTQTVRACANGACGLVSADVHVYDVSDVASTTRRALCPGCVARIRVDSLLIVERADDERADLRRAASFAGPAL
jgi:hypothetical protein